MLRRYGVIAQHHRVAGALNVCNTLQCFPQRSRKKIARADPNRPNSGGFRIHFALSPCVPQATLSCFSSSTGSRFHPVCERSVLDDLRNAITGSAESGPAIPRFRLQGMRPKLSSALLEDARVHTKNYL